MSKLLKLHNLMAKATEDYTAGEKKTMYEILNYWQMLINSGVLKEDELRFTVDIAQFKKITINEGKNSDKINNIVKGIMKKPFAFTEGKKEMFFTPIPTIEIDNEKKEVTMELHKDCMNYISCKMKGQFYFADLLRIEKLSSPQAIKMYELLESQRKVNKGFLIIGSSQIKELFNIKREYTKSDLKTKVIEKSLKKIQEIIPEFKYNSKYASVGKSWNKVTISFSFPSYKIAVDKKPLFFDVTEHLKKAFDEFENTGELNINYKKVINQLDRIEDPNGFKKIERELGEDAAGYVELPNTREWLVERIVLGTSEYIDEQLENKIMNM